MVGQFFVSQALCLKKFFFRGREMISCSSFTLGLSMRGSQELTRGKVASSRLSLSKLDWVVLVLLIFFELPHTTSNWIENNSSKLCPPMQPYLPLALTLPGQSVISKRCWTNFLLVDLLSDKQCSLLCSVYSSAVPSLFRHLRGPGL